MTYAILHKSLYGNVQIYKRLALSYILRSRELALQSFPEEGLSGPFPDRACLARKDCLREAAT